MTFVQLISFTSDRTDELEALDAQWRADTAGRHTILREAHYADRNTPNRYHAIVEFADHAAAMRNSSLPETVETAAKLASMSTDITFLDLDLVAVTIDRTRERAAELVTGLLEFVSTASVPAGVLADDLVCDLNVPSARLVFTGAEACAEVLRQDAPGGTRIESSDWSSSPDGFVLEYESRSNATADRPSTYSRQLVRATVRDGVIARIAVYCTGNWDAATEAQYRV